jgi:hypothetical protein
LPTLLWLILPNFQWQRYTFNNVENRPGISSLQLSDLSELPAVTTTGSKLFHTTPAPVAVKDVEGLIGEKIRGLSVGVHRLNLDDILDMDKLTLEKSKQVSIL